MLKLLHVCKQKCVQANIQESIQKYIPSTTRFDIHNSIKINRNFLSVIQTNVQLIRNKNV